MDVHVLTEAEREWASWALMKVAQERPELIDLTTYDETKKVLRAESKPLRAALVGFLEHEGEGVLQGMIELNMGLENPTPGEGSVAREHERLANAKGRLVQILRGGLQIG